MALPQNTAQLRTFVHTDPVDPAWNHPQWVTHIGYTPRIRVVCLRSTSAMLGIPLADLLSPRTLNAAHSAVPKWWKEFCSLPSGQDVPGIGWESPLTKQEMSDAYENRAMTFPRASVALHGFALLAQAKNPAWHNPNMGLRVCAYFLPDLKNHLNANRNVRSVIRGQAGLDYDNIGFLANERGVSHSAAVAVRGAVPGLGAPVLRVSNLDAGTLHASVLGHRRGNQNVKISHSHFRSADKERSPCPP